MKNLIITFSISEVTTASIVITSLLVGYIFLAKRNASKFDFSADFSTNNYLLGILVSMVITLLCINVAVEDIPYVYALSDIGPEDTFITPITKWEEPKVIPPPPEPPKETEIIKPIQEAKIIEVTKLDEVIEVEDFTDQSDIDEQINIDTMMKQAKAEVPEYVPIEDEEDEIVPVPEVMPRFPGCEDMIGTIAEKRACAEKLLLEFMYKNIRYPDMARDISLSGTVIVRFVVDKEGNITDAKILREIGGGCGKAALDAVELMNAMPERWSPGRQRGRVVKVQFTLPIKFQLM